MVRISKIKNDDLLHLGELYDMMLERKFPHVPDEMSEAFAVMQNAEIYGIIDKNKDDGRLTAGFIFGEITENSAFFDAICSEDSQGKWATPAILRQLYNIAFNDMGLEFVWTEPQNPTALKATLKSGFQIVNGTMDSNPVLVLSKNSLPRKFRN